ncbi:uncharacterized protein LOC9635489 isoform X1 [Selaginella moellendorffii]|uniref:uncharacterized protein LOC9635489 isoform X1 n=1 Tax=Selaginella moellendorffii TaxID=88036 RepID=UPI000D1C7008|nr:uncharacterized protein LOC9635489 isoform X1 [Selaginella moellendorffii]|eukprot:XP_024520752.1 uncharacterized protein LOC9635489 isoform X1 [Selaginella moellendorffii]
MGQGGRGEFLARRYRFSEDLMDLDGDASTSGGEGYIVHYVSKLDTLAGIAIKYGVEVADVKRLNGLSTDLQMFARKSLRIPSSAKHPPSEQFASHSSSANSEQPRLGRHSFCDIVLPNKSEEPTKVSSAMSLMRGYYGLSTSKLEGEGTEMEVYRTDNGYQSEDEPFTPRDQVSNRPRAHAPTNLATEPKLASFNSMVSMARDFVAHEVEKARERVAVRRRPKGEALAAEDHSAKQQLLGDRTNYAVRSSVPRPKASRLGLEVEVDCPAGRAVVFNSGGEAGNGKGLRSGKVVEELIFKLKKSPSAPNFQDEKPPPSSMLKNGSKGDLASWSQAQIQSSVTIPLLDSFTRRSKAALD